MFFYNKFPTDNLKILFNIWDRIKTDHYVKNTVAEEHKNVAYIHNYQNYV